MEKNPNPYTNVKASRTIPRDNYCLVIETIYLGPFDKTTVEQIAKPEFWENKTTVKRIFPFSGLGDKNGDKVSISYMGDSGYWWVNTNYYNVYVHRENGYTIKKSGWDASGTNAISVRPFYLDIF